MGGAESDSSSTGDGGSAAVVARLPLWRRWDGRDWQTVCLLGLLLAIQLCGAVLGSSTNVWARQFHGDVSMAMFGAMSAEPALLALWAVFGPQRVAVRLPLTLWLMAAFAEFVEY